MEKPKRLVVSAIEENFTQSESLFPGIKTLFFKDNDRVFYKHILPNGKFFYELKKGKKSALFDSNGKLASFCGKECRELDEQATSYVINQVVRRNVSEDLTKDVVQKIQACLPEGVFRIDENKMEISLHIPEDGAIFRREGRPCCKIMKKESGYEDCFSFCHLSPFNYSIARISDAFVSGFTLGITVCT